MKILHLICSPRGQASESYRLSQTIVGHLLNSEPTATVIIRPIGGAITDLDEDYATALGATERSFAGTVSRRLYVPV
ncbi:NAD(P)H-dependent oxidoreductase [Bradyrhizobium sp. 6(2017)]|uniref:NAD(P)H-dependent oxidoreductase n=1 Tax=Bradyrhizobium sp. 6(2017) TaxID=1197460 RepID=UPI0021126D1A|nr:NAD(P)H-dependent oxidoreductase [Bradyrhizobium sp. 6(2017)]